MRRTAKSWAGLGLAACLAGAGMWPGPALADAVSAAIGQSLEAYQRGKELDALDTLNQAMRLLRERLSAHLDNLLPAPLPGWNMDDTLHQTSAPGMAEPMFAVERTYRKGDGAVTLQLAVNSPLLSGMRMLLENPLSAEAEGAEILSLDKQRVLSLSKGAGRASEELIVVIGQQLLVSVQGQRVNRKILLDYLRALDYSAFKADWLSGGGAEHARQAEGPASAAAPPTTANGNAQAGTDESAVPGPPPPRTVEDATPPKPLAGKSKDRDPPPQPAGGLF